MFANQNTAAKLRQKFTIEHTTEEFGLDDCPSMGLGALHPIHETELVVQSADLDIANVREKRQMRCEKPIVMHAEPQIDAVDRAIRCTGGLLA